MKECPKCGISNPDDATECISCHAKIEKSKSRKKEKTEVDIISSTIYCPSCGMPHKSSEKVCSNCGHKLNGEQPVVTYYDNTTKKKDSPFNIKPYGTLDTIAIVSNIITMILLFVAMSLSVTVYTIIVVGIDVLVCIFSAIAYRKLKNRPDVLIASIALANFFLGVLLTIGESVRFMVNLV